MKDEGTFYVAVGLLFFIIVIGCALVATFSAIMGLAQLLDSIRIFIMGAPANLPF